MPPKPLKVATVIQGIEETNGNLAAVARRFGVKRQAVWEYVQRHPSCKTAYEEQRQTMVDSAESVLYRKVLAGEDTTALIFFLKTQGKARGYTEKTETEQSGDLRIVVEYADDAPPRTPPPTRGAAADSG